MSEKWTVTCDFCNKEWEVKTGVVLTRDHVSVSEDDGRQVNLCDECKSEIRKVRLEAQRMVDRHMRTALETRPKYS